MPRKANRACMHCCLEPGKKIQIWWGRRLSKLDQDKSWSYFVISLRNFLESKNYMLLTFWALLIGRKENFT